MLADCFCVTDSWSGLSRSGVHRQGVYRTPLRGPSGEGIFVLLPMLRGSQSKENMHCYAV